MKPFPFIVNHICDEHTILESLTQHKLLVNNGWTSKFEKQLMNNKLFKFR